MPRRRYLVCYDIREAHRLQNVGLTIKRYGDRLQYSVYVCDLDRSEKIHLLADLGAVIKHTVDTVAIIDLGETDTQPANRIEWLGAQVQLPRHSWRVW